MHILLEGRKLQQYQQYYLATTMKLIHMLSCIWMSTQIANQQILLDLQIFLLCRYC